jgi:UDP-GlcNAc3NAcA epimerase
VTIVGARPQFIKAAVLSRLIRREHPQTLSEYLVHTGQHYDANMSDLFFEQLMIPRPAVNLGVGSGSHGEQTGRMLAAIERVLFEQKPDAVLVYGDTNSTLAGALAAGKLNIPVAHVEAGLRSYERTMPEEQNRIVADHLSSWLFCPTETARENLRREGITEGAWTVGDIMYDASLFYRRLAREGAAGLYLPAGLPKEFYLLTLHRAENTDSPVRLAAIVEVLNSLVEFLGVFPVHPRTRLALQRNGLKLGPHIHLIEPVGFFEMLTLEESCRFIVTDSGGVQKEACFFRKPCITLRDQTEWVETVNSGWNVLVGADPQRIRAAFHHVKAPDTTPDFYGRGDTAGRILEILIGSLESSRSSAQRAKEEECSSSI